ncbi:hypothetical protein [Streptomyces litchfieldiae]|uniref:hypothetical protein n=1 Tax=Streptomyces litchfieldiae TaxID=3075543 RepID=UPI002888F94A|nr:hypothetical protein [Streptomyces sp. DSM 44938]
MGHGYSRRQVLVSSGAAVAGAVTTGIATGTAAAEERGGSGRRLPWILDAVMCNPGESVPLTAFDDLQRLRDYGFNGKIVTEWHPPSTAITYDSLDPEIFPQDSDERVWVETNAGRIDARIRQIRAAGLKALYFIDIVTLPNRLVDRYADKILDSEGRINLDYEETRRIHRVMLAEIFDRFPDLDGLVVRTGETYLPAVPYFRGNNPVTRGADSHVILLDILRDEVCVKRDKLLFYRTWSFDAFTTSPDYYLDVTDRIEPHPNLIFSIKHTAGDFLRTYEFNPTLTLGRHPQIVEVQCQREYEAKGAVPDYVMNGVIDGFEEYPEDAGRRGLADIRDHPNFQGVWTWSRGGGWRGPYIPNEMWCDLNVYVASHWAQDVDRTEAEVFGDWMRRAGLKGADRDRFRRLALLSATGTLYGKYTGLFTMANPFWMRDQFIGGSDDQLKADFERIRSQGQIDTAIQEKADAVATWREVARLARNIQLPDPADRDYLRISSEYGLRLYTAVHHAWAVMLKGVEGDSTGTYDVAAIREHLAAFDTAWLSYLGLREHPQCPTLYEPYAFGAQDVNGLYHSDRDRGAKPTLDHYRAIVGDG